MDVKSSLDAMSIPQQRPWNSSTNQPTSTVSSSTQRDSDGKNSSGTTSRIKKKQSDKLDSVKKTTLLVVIIADVIVLLALAYQMIWLNESLHGALEDRVTDIMGFYRFRYNEVFSRLTLGANLFALNQTFVTSCMTLKGVKSAQDQYKQRLMNDLQGRRNEIELITDTNGIIMANGGSATALGQTFNPQNIVTNTFQQYPDSSQQMQVSVMVPRSLFVTVGSSVFDAKEQYHPELSSWRNSTETLVRLVLTPLVCGTANVHGYVVMGNAITPRKYDIMNRLVSLTTSSLVTVLARNSNGTWQTEFSYNKPGDIGYPLQFPDLLPHFDSGYLNDAFASGSVQIGRLSLGDIEYTFGALPIQGPVLGSTTAGQIPPTAAVIIHAEPENAIKKVVSTTLLWHVPFGVVMTILSFVTLKLAYVRFLNPMKLLIESVRKKKLKEFNDRIRELKSSKSAFWALLSKTVLVQAVLLGLIFANRYVLVSSIEHFTSATTQGRVGPFLVAHNSRAISESLHSWTGFSSVVSAATARNVTSDFRRDFDLRFQLFAADAMYMIGLDSTVIVSSYESSEGMVFPEVGIMDYFKNDALATFTTITNWHQSYVKKFTPHRPNKDDAPVFIQFAVSPITSVTFNATTNSLQKGNLVGAMVVMTILNNKTSLWDSIIESFGTGYYGLFEWDRFNQKFAVVSSVLKTSDRVGYSVDITKTYPNLLEDGIVSAYQTDGMFVQEGLNIESQSDTVCISPFFSTDDVVLTPLMLNAYQATGVPQDRYNVMLSQQVFLQGSIMGIECLASVIALLCTYWPMKKFLDNLEKAFNVPSMSNEKRQKMEQRATAMMETTKPETLTVDARSGIRASVQSSQIAHLSSM